MKLLAQQNSLEELCGHCVCPGDWVWHRVH
jgi:hypothetical protein